MCFRWLDFNRLKRITQLFQEDTDYSTPGHKNQVSLFFISNKHINNYQKNKANQSFGMLKSFKKKRDLKSRNSFLDIFKNVQNRHVSRKVRKNYQKLTCEHNALKKFQ
jgi:hypothetical protein